MRLSRYVSISCLGLLSTAVVWAQTTDFNRLSNSPYFSTTIRVVLQRSRAGISMQGIIPAAVRVNGQVHKSLLSPAPYLFSVADKKIRMVRVPYQPVSAESFELIWPAEKAGFRSKEKTYRGRAGVFAQNGEVFLINTLPLETYLAATVGGEMNADWELEALKAQAVAARSYALSHKEFPRHKLYDVDSTTDDQVYNGISGESAKTWNAVKQTRGIFLAAGDRPLQAHYHSRCGGQTELASGVWQKRAGLGANVVCAFCQRNPFRWTAKWSLSDFLKKLGLSPSSFLALTPVKQSANGRILVIEASNGEESRRLSADNLRRTFGYSTFKSALFTLSTSDEEVKVEGVGMGHGVGMCQWGAKALAEKGKSFDAILRHYYPANPLRRLDENLLSQRPNGLFAGIHP